MPHETKPVSRVRLKRLSGVFGVTEQLQGLIFSSGTFIPSAIVRAVASGRWRAPSSAGRGKVRSGNGSKSLRNKSW